MHLRIVPRRSKEVKVFIHKILTFTIVNWEEWLSTPFRPIPRHRSNRLPQSVSQKWVCITLRSRWAEEKWRGTDRTYYICYHTLKTCLSILRKKESIINIVSRALTKELWVEWRKGQFWKVLKRRSSQDSLTDRKWGLDEYRNKDIVNFSSLLLDMKVKYLIAVKWKKS